MEQAFSPAAAMHPTFFRSLLRGVIDSDDRSLGEGIHWPDLDEDISVESLLAGLRSRESQESLRRWLVDRRSSPKLARRRREGDVM